MTRQFLIAFALVGFATPVMALLSISGPTTYAPGDTIELALIGESEGNASGALFAVLTVDVSLSYVSGASGVLSDSSSTFSWMQTSDVGSCGGAGLNPNQCVAVDAFEPTVGTVALDLLPSTLSTFTFDTTNATGDLFFSLDPEGPGFFGLPGTSAIITMIPEPSTGALMSLGMIALAASGRRGKRV